MAKRLAKTVTNWAELEKRVPPEQLQHFFAFKRKSEAYMRRMMLNPPDPPKIDWDAYKKIVPVPGLVDKYKDAYTNLKIPYPEDKLTASVDQQAAQMEQELVKYRDYIKKLLDTANKEIAKIDALPKYEDMTLEMAYETFPEMSVDFVRKPTFWPHTDDEQLGYVDPTIKVPR